VIEPILYFLALFITTFYPLGYEPLFILQNRYLNFGFVTVDIVALSPLYFLISYITIFLLLHILFAKNDDRLHRIRVISIITSFVALTLILFIFHLPVAINEFCSNYLGGSPFAKEFGYVLPFFVFMGINALLHTVFLRKIDPQTAPPLIPHLYFRFKTFLCFAGIPIAIICSLSEISYRIPAVDKFVSIYPSCLFILIASAIFAIILVLPYYVRTVFSTEEIKTSAIRQSLDPIFKKANLEGIKVYKVNTHGAGVANAFIAGGYGKKRSVFFTDELLKAFTARELAAILSHEVAHLKKGHILYFAGLIVCLIGGSIVFVLTLYSITKDEIITSLPLLLAVVLFWFVVFSYCSKRFECEADYHASQLLGSHTRFIRTLSKVGVINQIPAHHGSIRHYSIIHRCMILELLHSLPEFRKKFEKTVKRIKLSIITGAIIFSTALVYFVIAEFGKSGRYEQMWNLEIKKQKAHTAYIQGKYEKAKTILQKVMQDKDYKYDPWCHYMLGLIYYQQGNDEEAIESLKTAQELGLLDPLPRLHATNLINTLTHSK
jgi:Zn-dependent protease with chaperone function